MDAPVEHVLEAVYFDTADLRLLRARVTLRRRTGGVGRRLAPQAARRRRPARAARAARPGDDEGAEGAQRAGRRRAARGSPTPVATLRTRRVVTSLRDPDGALLAEVADDTVTATVPPADAGQPMEVQSWREVEVELGRGDDALAAAIGERLVRAGARPSDSASKIGRALGGRLDASRTPATERRPPTRGSSCSGRWPSRWRRCRRPTSCSGPTSPTPCTRSGWPRGGCAARFAAFRTVLDRGGHRSAGRRAGVARRRSWPTPGTTRSRWTHLRAVVAAEPEELVLGPVAARLQQAELRRCTAGARPGARTLSEPRYLALLDALHGLLGRARRHRPRPRTGVRPALRAATRRVRPASCAAAWTRRAGRRRTTRGAALHEVRKAAKQVRYIAEVGRGEDRRMRRVARAAKRAQKVLGERQDTVVTRELCRRLGVVAAAAGENSFTYGRLHALEQARAERAERDFWEPAPKLRAVLGAG